MSGALSDTVHDWLVADGLDPAMVVDLITRALQEDLAGGRDETTVATVDADQRATVALVTRTDGVVAGLHVALATFELVALDTDVRALVGEGAVVRAGDVVAQITARTRDLLLAERTALNFVGHLSGVSTLTRQWVDAVAGTGAVIRDTRKTTPGLRALEKFAVRCGGGQNHRMSLSDAALIKDNHVAAAGSVTAAVSAIRRHAPQLVVEVEVDSLAQLDEALSCGVDLILLDNMAPPMLRRAVERTRARGGRVLLEASGGLTLATAREVALCGVDFLSVGALTHSAPVLDLGLDFVDAEGSREG